MVLVHGYGGGGAIFYKLLKDLASYFHVYAVDLLGMGSSGRPQFPLKQASQNTEIAENFFIDSLKQWKEKIGIKGKYYLAGHSLGGYICSLYTMKYPDEIEKLILISPAGIPERPKEYS